LLLKIGILSKSMSSSRPPSSLSFSPLHRFPLHHLVVAFFFPPDRRPQPSFSDSSQQEVSKEEQGPDSLTLLERAGVTREELIAALESYTFESESSESSSSSSPSDLFSWLEGLGIGPRVSAFLKTFPELFAVGQPVDARTFGTLLLTNIEACYPNKRIRKRRAMLSQKVLSFLLRLMAPVIPQASDKEARNPYFFEWKTDLGPWALRRILKTLLPLVKDAALKAKSETSRMKAARRAGRTVLAERRAKIEAEKQVQEQEPEPEQEDGHDDLAVGAEIPAESRASARLSENGNVLAQQDGTFGQLLGSHLVLNLLGHLDDRENMTQLLDNVINILRNLRDHLGDLQRQLLKQSDDFYSESSQLDFWKELLTQGCELLHTYRKSLTLTSASATPLGSRPRTVIESIGGVGGIVGKLLNYWKSQVAVGCVKTQQEREEATGAFHRSSARAHIGDSGESDNGRGISNSEIHAATEWSLNAVFATVFVGFALRKLQLPAAGGAGSGEPAPGSTTAAAATFETALGQALWQDTLEKPLRETLAEWGMAGCDAKPTEDVTSAVSFSVKTVVLQAWKVFAGREQCGSSYGGGGGRPASLMGSQGASSDALSSSLRAQLEEETKRRVEAEQELLRLQCKLRELDAGSEPK